MCSCKYTWLLGSLLVEAKRGHLLVLTTQQRGHAATRREIQAEFNNAYHLL